MLKIAMIIPAAGSSTRHPPNKLLNKMGHQTVIEKTLGIFHRQNIHIYLITGYQSVELTTIISKELYPSVKIVENKHFMKGLSESLKAGVLAATDKYDYFGFSLGDKPFIKQKTIDKLLDELERNKPEILIPTLNGLGGHPAFFIEHYRQELMDISGDIGGKILVEKHINDVTFFPVNDEGILLDMDRVYQQKNESNQSQ